MHRRTRVRSRRFAFIDTFFPAQRAFFDDKSPRKAALTGRRAGKSSYAAGALIDAALETPDTFAFYIALTRKSASLRFVWKEIRRLDRVYKLGCEFNITERIVRLKNGSEIWLSGATNEDDIERLRGAPFVLAVIDEAGSFGEHVRDLVFEVLEASTIDYDGQIVLIGTPTPDCTGLFFEITEGSPDPDGRKHEGWSVHRWTVLDNPYVPKHPTEEIPNAKAWLKRHRARTAQNEDDPAYLRNWRGIWTPSRNALVYREFTERRNVITALPRAPRGSSWFFGMGVDLGYDDPTVLTLVQWNDQLPDVYVSRVYKQKNMIPAQIAAAIKRVAREAGIGFEDLSFVVVDQGGGTGKMVTEEFVDRYRINAQGAEKTRKRTFIEFANGDFRSGKLKIVRAPDGSSGTEPLIDELKKIAWDPDRPGKEDKRFANDCADSMLYAFREARHYFFDDAEAEEPDEVRPARGSMEESRRQSEAHEDEYERESRRNEREREDDY